LPGRAQGRTRARKYRGDAVDRGNSIASCRFIVLGALGGAILCGGLFCGAVEIAGEREDAAIKREIQERTAKGEEDAVMEHKTMPIAVAFGFLMELAVVSGIGGLLGGIVAWLKMTARRVPRLASPEARVGVCVPRACKVPNDGDPIGEEKTAQ
jgi:hypothetical protein